MTAGEILAAYHLLQPVLQQRHSSREVYTYWGQPTPFDPFAPCGLLGRHWVRSMALARRAYNWAQQRTTMPVYHAVCWMCQEPCGIDVRGGVSMGKNDWPRGITWPVAFAETARVYRAVRCEVGLWAHDPHVGISRDVMRVQAIILSKQEYRMAGNIQFILIV